ncbi:MAG: 1-deoxy-D-xylulose-5-phosphate reductoisomerase, partial [Bacteroidales bacterium]|nr:1-deoxy-D-xylulose-5-phosphate reductoisomerase [Bacteroidales bacterium]
DRLDLFKVASFTFREPDTMKFPCIRIAYESIARGGNIPCIMNAANEVAVAAFLRDRIKFTDIPSVIERTIEKSNYIAKPTIEEIFESDKEGRIFAKEFVNLD